MTRNVDIHTDTHTYTYPYTRIHTHTHTYTVSSTCDDIKLDHTSSPQQSHTLSPLSGHDQKVQQILALPHRADDDDHDDHNDDGEHDREDYDDDEDDDDDTKVRVKEKRKRIPSAPVDVKWSEKHQLFTEARAMSFIIPVNQMCTLCNEADAVFSCHACSIPCMICRLCVQQHDRIAPEHPLQQWDSKLCHNTTIPPCNVSIMECADKTVKVCMCICICGV
jgi:hypothetical protein